MPVLSLKEIDVMREAAREHSDARHREIWVPSYEQYRTIADRGIAEVEARIEEALMRRIWCPVCPFCGGAMAPPPHPDPAMLYCVDCNAVARRPVP